MKEILSARLRDWRIGQGENDIPKEDRDEYTISMMLDEACGQIYFDVINATAKNQKGLTGIIEINLGRPCVHLGVEVNGDNLLHAFALEEGLVVTSETNSKSATKTAEPSRYTYNSFNGTLYVAE